MSAAKAKQPAKLPKKPAKLAKDTIYVDVDDEITAIIDKVEAAKEKIVALVLPKRATMLQSIVNMRLLKRSADSADKSVVLISSDEALWPLAGAAGLHVAKNLQSLPAVPPSPKGTALPAPELAEDLPDEEPQEGDEKSAKLDYHRSIGELAASHAGDDSEAIALEDEDEAAVATKTTKPAPPPKNKRLKIPNFDRFRLLMGLGILGIIGLVVFLILALAVLPKAKITVQTSSTPVSANLNLTASDKAKSLDLASHLIPALLKTADQTSTQQVAATGQQNLGQKATGKVSLSNCTNNPVTVPAGTGVSTNGLTFITQSGLSLDSGNFDSKGNCKTTGTHVGSVNVTAQNAGTKYNIGPASSFTVAGFPGVTGSSNSAMTGGTDNNVTIVSQQDIDNVKQKITSADSDKFTKDFEKQLSDGGLYVLTSTLKQSGQQIAANPDVGQQASNSSVTIKNTYSVLTVQKSDLTTAINDTLKKQIDQSKEKINTGDVLKDATVSIQNQSAPTEATLVVGMDTTAVPVIDGNVLKKQAAGQKAGDIKASLANYPGVKNVDVHFSPFWVSRAPKNPNKITVVLQQVKGGG